MSCLLLSDHHRGRERRGFAALHGSTSASRPCSRHLALNLQKVKSIAACRQALLTISIRQYVALYRHVHRAPSASRPYGRTQHPAQVSLSRMLPRGPSHRRQDDRHFPGRRQGVQRLWKHRNRLLGKSFLLRSIPYPQNNSFRRGFLTCKSSPQSNKPM